MKHRWSYIVLFFLLMAFTAIQQADASTANGEDRDLTARWLAFSQSHDTHQATFTDSSQLLRICNSRPERIVSIHPLASGEQTSRHFQSFTFKNAFHNHYPGLQSTPTSAIMSMPSAEYFVFCLRRLLC